MHCILVTPVKCGRTPVSVKPGPRSLFVVLCTLHFVVIWPVVLANDCHPGRTSTDAATRKLDDDENEDQGHCEKLENVELEHNGPSDLNLSENTKSGLIRKMAEGSPIWGMAVLDGELYVVRRSTEFIEVHDIPIGKMVRILMVEGLTNPFDMVSSDRCKCLFVSDWKTKSVVQVHKNGDVIKWPMSTTPFGLSINSAGNLLVTFTGINMIAEFTTGGDLVRTVKVSDSVVRPWYTVERPDDGGFLISCVHMKSEDSRCSRYTVGTVDSHGESATAKIVSPYSDRTMECPAQMNLLGAVQLAAVNRSGSVVVSDRSGGSVYVLSRSVDHVVVGAAMSSEVSSPFRVCFDDASGLTFVAEYTTDDEGLPTEGHVKVFRVNLSAEATDSSDDEHLSAESDNDDDDDEDDADDDVNDWSDDD